MSNVTKTNAMMISPGSPQGPARYCGLVTVSVTEGLHAGKDFIAAFKSLVGGRINAYDSAIAKAKTLAAIELCKQAQEMGANAVFDYREVLVSLPVKKNAVITISVYGTAVILADAKTDALSEKESSIPGYSLPSNHDNSDSIIL